MKDDELVKALRNAQEKYKNDIVSVGRIRIDEMARDCADRIEQLAKENAELKERNYELDDALRDMVCQFSTHDGKLKHSFMGAEENAYCVLDLRYGAPVKTLWENRPSEEGASNEHD